MEKERGWGLEAFGTVPAPIINHDAYIYGNMPLREAYGRRLNGKRERNTRIKILVYKHGC